MLTMRTERGVGLRPPVNAGTGVCGVTCSLSWALPVGRSDAGPASPTNMTFVLSEWRVEPGAGGGGRLGSHEGYPSLAGMDAVGVEGMEDGTTGEVGEVGSGLSSCGWRSSVGEEALEGVMTVE